MKKEDHRPPVVPAASGSPPILGQGEVLLYRSAKPMGDALFITAAAREIRKRNPAARIHVKTHWPALFGNNPDVASAAAIRDPFTPPAGAYPIVYDNPWPPASRRHVIEIICRNLGLEGPVDLRTYYVPTDEERRLAAEMRPPNGRPLVVVHPFCGFFAARTKQWHFAHWKRLLEIIPPEIETIRFGNHDEPATPAERANHRDILDADPRIVAALLASADAFVGQDSGMAHLATALGVPAVVIFTGYVPPEVFGYPQNRNLKPDLPYIPCWQGDGCPPCRGEVCTQAVKPETVLVSLLDLLNGR
jgi:ADP-heptose:LPS heptosyltransferase